MAAFPPPDALARREDGLSRRALMVAGLAGATGLVTHGCSVDRASDDSPARPSETTPDVAAATRALAEITETRVAVSRTAARHPDARSALRGLEGMHRAHEASLADAVPDRSESPEATPSPYVVPRRRAAAERRLRAREQRLHDTLDELALKAQSGDFARLLASMGAAVGQRLAGWPA